MSRSGSRKLRRRRSGLRTKIQSLFSKSFALEYKIIVFCETCLSKNYINAELLYSNLFNIYRKNRCPIKSGLENTDIDQIILKICFSNSFELILL